MDYMQFKMPATCWSVCVCVCVCGGGGGVEHGHAYLLIGN